ncbi:MAG: ADP-ribosylglycohydrolase family protein, partial [Caulobacter sp.]|nr:ADP-ribosylglycohydrolase family protein [Caulobacter sp.]
MTRARTSETHPLTVAELPLAAGGAIGLAPCPGRQGPSHQGPPWERDLDADLAAIRAWGADALLCLIGVDERAALRVANLPDAAGRFGLTFVEAPLTEGLPPDAAFAARWAEIGPPLRALLRGGGRLLIHCRGGLGRSGTVAARLLVELGQDAEGAIATVRAARPGAIQTDEQVEHILGSEPVADGVSERAVLIAAAHEAALAAVEEAGALLRAEFHRAGGPRGRGEHADIDAEIEALLRERLLGPFPWGWCGEETADRASDSPFCWVVDPHDGTKAFLEGRRGSAVSVALLHDGAPVLGVVKAFACPDDGGDLIAWAEGCGPLRRNGEPVDIVRPERLERGSVVALSAAAAEYPVGNAKAVAPARFVALPSIAYRLALAAVGEVEAAVSLQHLSSWDVAAGHALLRGAGMALLDGAGRPVTYRRDGRAGVARCFGGAEPVARDLATRPWRVNAGKAAPRLALPLPVAADADALGRAVGCLMGQLAGDALGSLVEFQSPAEIARAHPRGVRDMRDGGCWNTLAGQPTDDSELALAPARDLVAARGWWEDGVLAAYRAWYRSGPFDVGGTTRAALG